MLFFSEAGECMSALLGAAKSIKDDYLGYFPKFVNSFQLDHLFMGRTKLN